MDKICINFYWMEIIRKIIIKGDLFMNNHPIEVLMETAMNSIKEMIIVNLNGINADFEYNFKTISNNKENRAKISVEEQREELFKAVTDYPPLDWNYEKSCIYNLPNVVEYRETFEHLENIKPNKNNVFL